MHFEIQAECPDTGARAGLLHTAHGIIETPVFMPVGTQATVKGIPQRDLERDLDAPIIPGQHLPSLPPARPRADLLSANWAVCTSLCRGRGLS